VPVVELLLPVDAMGQRLVGREAGLFEQEKAICRVKERKREARLIYGGFRVVRRRLERERALGSGEAAKINGFNACRACIEWCAGLKVQISVTELIACFVHI